MRPETAYVRQAVTGLKSQEWNTLRERCLLPGGFAVLETKCQRFPAFDHFARQYQIRSVLFDLGASDLNLVGSFKLYSHIVEKLLGAKKDLDRIRAAL